MKDCVVKGKVGEAKIIERDTAGAAHRLIVLGIGKQLLETPDGIKVHLRKEDLLKPGFVSQTRKRADWLLRFGLGNHVLFGHLRPKEVTALTDEALRWNISAEGQKATLDPEAATGIFESYQALHLLPSAAHRRYPLLLEGYSLGHSTRVAIYAALLAQDIGDKEVTPRIAAETGFFHDFGKLHPTIRDLVRIPGKLDREQYEKVKLHTSIGANLWNEVNAEGPVLVSGKVAQYSVYSGILEHHLRPDGKGYPENLNGKSQSLISKIISVADTFDAMTSLRKYRCGESEESVDFAREEMRRCSGLSWNREKVRRDSSEGQFDPEFAERFLALGLRPVYFKPLDLEPCDTSATV
jgi:hypothetical protein